jgi:TPR repeat protein
VAAEAGDVVAQVDLASLLLKRQTNPRFSQAAPVHDWFENAAEAGDLVGAYNYAVCLSEGVGVERDEARAAEWFRRAAEEVVDAQYWYGRMLAEGRGVSQNLEEARAWLQRAADMNVVEAQMDLAELLVKGMGGPRDDATARQLYERAAQAGHAGAAWSLAELRLGPEG